MRILMLSPIPIQPMYDLIYCHFLSTLPYVVDKGVPVIWDQHNVDRVYWQHKVAFHHRRPWRRLLIQWNLAKIMRLETAMLPKVAGLITVSPTDQALMRPLLPATTPCWVAANGVDTTYYQLTPRRPVPSTAAQPLVLGFFGSLDLELNQMAALTLLHAILPRVTEQLPDRKIALILLGCNPPQWLYDLVAHRAHAGITLTGTVDDVRPYLHQMDILVLPLQSGAGTKLRVVEAMASGVCVVGSDLAFTGLTGAHAGQHYCLAQTPA